MRHAESLGLLLDHAQDKIAVVDEHGTFRYVNDAARRILGFHPDDLVGENAFEYVHPEDVTDVQQAFTDVIRSDSFTEVTVEYRYRTHDDDWVWLESRLSNLTDSALDGFVVSSRDITDRVQAEQDRQETAARLQEIAATAGDVLWMFTADWSDLLFMNPAYEGIYGQSPETLEEDPTAFLDTIHPDDVPAVREAMDCLSAGQSVDIEYRVNPETDYGTWVWVQGEPIIEDGEVVRIAGFTRDITDRKRRERQLFVMDTLLRHTLRNDINVILGTAAVIEEEAPEVADQTAIIRQTGEDLLASAAKERQIIDLVSTDGRRERLHMPDLVTSAVETVREEFPTAAIEVQECASVAVRGRPELEAALIEVIENAVVHADHDTPTVEVTVRADGSRVMVIVEDEAAPLPPADADVLTGEHDMDQVYHSSGLGCWLVYWAVELSEGEMQVDTDDERGNRITITLPRAT